jgi:DNA adenine methylase
MSTAFQYAAPAADLRAPFPWFGGKSRVADLVWDRFGNVPNYVEPFFGSGAVLLARPHAAGIETINDLDCMVANFWRALQADPEGVARWCDQPVNEADQHARHLWLCSQEIFRERMKTEPDYFDAKIAGWWVWGQCIYIGSGWCDRQFPEFDEAGIVKRKLPHLGDAGRGVNRQLPHLGNAGTGVLLYMLDLAGRLRRVRVCCGDWSRVCGPSPTFKHGVTGVFLDPPYSDDADRDATLYRAEDLTVAHGVRAWAIANGDNPELRIALCGYAGEHNMPDSWECIPWKARGGYGSQSDGRGRANAGRERVWFSPYCLKPGLFGDIPPLEIC